MVFKTIKPRFINSRARVKDRRSASFPVKSIDKKMGHGKGNWGSELDAQMREMETNGTDIITAAEWEAIYEEQLGFKSVSAPGKENKLGKVTGRQKKKSRKILQIVRNFGERATQKKGEAATAENDDHVAGYDKTKNAPADSVGDAAKKLSAVKEAVEKKGATSEEARVKATDTAKAKDAPGCVKTFTKFRFNKKGPAWGQVAEGDKKKEKLPSIKELLKQKSQSDVK